MTAEQLKKKYFDFFRERDHKKLPNVSLVPEDVSSSALFISAGMHPLIPFLLGEPHPQGKKLVSNQRCIRTGDIEEVGDSLHLTFFEMLGNWSLGDYWKEQQISWSLEFLTKELAIPQEKISVSCFAGDEDAPRDEESAEVWHKLGIPKERIYFFGKKENWWGPVGETGPCGPDSEMFVDTGKKPCGPNCDPSCQCGKYFEVWNDVFMEYNKTKQGKFEPLKQRNVDTGMGVERVLTILQGKDDIYLIDALEPVVKKIEEISGKKYEGENKKAIRVIADHLRAAVFIIADGVEPGNKEQGYVLRRLIRRATFKMQQLPISRFRQEAARKISQEIVNLYSKEYPHLESVNIDVVLTEEIDRFESSLSRGLKFIQKYPKLDGKAAFDLRQTYGIPFEIIQEIAAKKGQKIERKDFEKELKNHRKISRAGAQKKFAGGLVDHSEEVTKLHTATHLLQAALRKVLGEEVFQKGSNITSERLRFDFSWKKKLSPKEIEEVEELVNQIIKKNLPVEEETMSFTQAKEKGALAVFDQKYGEKVKTYRVGPKEKPFSFEVCGGPHVDFTGKLGKFKIIKQEAVGSGVRRLYAVLEE